MARLLTLTTARNPSNAVICSSSVDKLRILRSSRSLYLACSSWDRLVR